MTQRLFSIVVYGTLRRGSWNHYKYMTGYLSVREVEIRGRLHWLSPGIPMLEVSPEDILAVGTTDYLADAALQARLTAELAAQPLPPAPPGPWDLIPAEVFTFDDPEARMPPLDRLEGFQPGGGACIGGCWLGRGVRPFGATLTGNDG